MTDPEPTPASERPKPESAPHIERADVEPPPQIPPDAVAADERAHAVEPGPRRSSTVFPLLYLLGFVVLAAGLAYIWQNPPPPREPVARAADLAALGDQVRALSDRVTRLEQRPAPTAAPASAPAPDLRPLEQRVAALERRPAPAGPDLGPIEQRLTALEQKPQTDAVSHAEFAALGGRVDALAGRQDQLAAYQQGLDTSMAGKLDAIDKRIGAEDQKFSAVDQRLTGLDKTAGQVSAVADRAARIARLQAAQAALDAGQKLGDLPGAPPALARFAQTDPPTEAQLRLSFPDAANRAEAASIPAATADQPFFTRVWNRAQALVTVRQGDHVVVGDPAAGIIAHARRELGAGDLAGAVATLGELTGPPAQAMAPWVAQARALLDARAALATMASHA
jgi:hypothetical protein